MLSANFGEQFSEIMPYLGHKIYSPVTPYHPQHYLLASEQQKETFIGCNPINNYHIRCFLVDPDNKTILATDIHLTGKPSLNYRCDNEDHSLYKLSSHDLEPTTPFTIPQTIFGVTQANLDNDYHYIVNNTENYVKPQQAWLFNTTSTTPAPLKS